MSSEHSESQESNSSSGVEDCLNISFEDITYKVRQGYSLRARKTIIDNVSGSFNAGELTVIMGQSGAGKSVLMDILAGYVKPTSGTICVNGSPRNEKLFRRRSCYIFQDSMMENNLTILESLRIAAELKLGNHIDSEQKSQRIEQIITSLDLSKAKDTRAGNLSGGQMKRLAIGVELVSDPPVMFLDEPTSGLDSSISTQLVSLLHELARQGRTMVVTMHQPSATLHHMIDRLYAIEGGRCAYIGSMSRLRSYLIRNELPCPEYHNPVEYLIDNCTDYAQRFADSCKSGKEKLWLTNLSETDSNVSTSSQEPTTVKKSEAKLTMLPPPKKNPTNKVLLALKSSYSTSNWKQFTTLTRRSLLTTWRDPTFTLMNTCIHVGMALGAGSLCWKIGLYADDVRNNYNFLNFCLMFVMYTAFSAVSIRIPKQIPIVRREHFNRWYTTGAYFASSVVSILPMQTISTLLYALIAYFMTGQPHDFLRFAGFSFILLLVSYVAASKGLVIGFLCDVQNSAFMGSFFLMPFTVFSGFFIRYNDASNYAKWIFNVSFLKHGLVGILVSIYDANMTITNTTRNPKMQCNGDFCYYKFKKTLIKENGFEDLNYTDAFVPILGIGCVVLVLAFIMLKLRLKYKW